MNGLRVDTSTGEVAGYTIGAVLGAGKDEGAADVATRKDFFQQVPFVFLVHKIHRLVHRVGGGGNRGYLHLLGVVQDGIGQLLRIRRHRGREEKILPVNANVTQTSLSPNGKEIAFVVRGEVFVTSVEGGYTKRITNTPQQERTVRFSPDGRSLYYATERGSSWDVYRAYIDRKEEPYFYASTVIKEEPVIATDADEFQPVISPDGKEIAYLEERNVLKVYNIASKKNRTILPKGVNFSYADGDQYYTWSPDGKWIAFRSDEGRWVQSEVALMKADGSGERMNLTESGFYDGAPTWAYGGKALLWVSDREGKKSLAQQGARELDVYAMFFDQEAYDKFKLNKDEFALLKEKEE